MVGSERLRTVTYISQRDDPRIAPFAGLRDRDLRRDHGGGFIAEGEVVLKVLVAQRRYRIRSVLLSEKRLPACEPLLAALPPESPVYAAPQELLEEIVGFAIHRGVLALGDRGAEPTMRELLGAPGPRIALGLAGVVNHDNVGAIFRNAAAFGVDAVALDHETCDPLYRKALRVSVGGSLVVPFARAASESALIDSLLAAGFAPYALSPRGEAELGAQGAAPPNAGRIALVLGAEGPGLSAATLARCHTLRIPMRPGWDSLNVAACSAIALHWLTAPR